MVAAGQFRDRATFQTELKTPTSSGGNTITWSDAFTVWAHLREQRGRERLEAGRPESGMPAILRVRCSSETAQITVDWRVLIDGVPYAIRSVSQPDRRRRVVEMVIERGRAT